MILVAFRYNQNTIISKLISWWTSDFKNKFSSKWKNTANHTEIELNGTRYSTGSQTNGWARITGSRQGQWRIYSIPHNEEEYEQMEALAEHFIGTKYDWLNIILSDVLKRNQGAGDRLTCDEGVSRILKLNSKFSELKKINNQNPKTLEDFVIKVIENT